LDFNFSESIFVLCKIFRNMQIKCNEFQRFTILKLSSSNI
jgi:hypothetical protein